MLLYGVSAGSLFITVPLVLSLVLNHNTIHVIGYSYNLEVLGFNTILLLFLYYVSQMLTDVLFESLNRFVGLI